MDVQALHRKILADPAGERYEAALSALGLTTPEPVVHKMSSITFKFGPAEFSCLRLGQLLFADRVAMYVTRVDKPSLCRLTGIEDPDKAKQHQQQPHGATPPPQQVPAQGPGQMLGGVPGVAGGGGGMADPMGLGIMGGAAGPGPGGFGMPAFGGAGPRPPMGGGPQGFPVGGGQQMLGMGGPIPPPMPPPMPPMVPPDPPQQQQGGPDAKRMRLEGGAGAAGGGGGGMADLESLLGKRSVMEKVKVEKGSELLDILAKPTARESARVEQFRTAGGSAIREHCPHLTKDDCRRANNAPVACPRLHFVRIIRNHTDVSLGNCSYLDTCRNMHTCKYVHYKPDPEPDVPGQPGAAEVARLRASVPKYLQALQDPQWINCDVRRFDMTVLGKFGVIMADPPWEIHQDLPYGTMKDDEMVNLNVGCLQDEGVIFVWVTGRAMELARECLAKWGYKRVDELIWVKTNQLQRLIRTGRTGHWLNHSKEHCLVGIKGNPQLNRYVDTDVVVAEVRETSRKPDEMYSLLERLSPGTRKLEIFARSHNCKPGWVGLGNQLRTVNIIEPEVRQRFAARYGFEPDPNVECFVN